jgi:hypothetical protein
MKQKVSWMNSESRLEMKDLRRLCKERVEESLTLEFKSCNELKPGTPFHDGKTLTARQREKVIDELTKDVVAFLNSAGGTVVYGIQEKKSRAYRIDESSAFNSKNTQDDIGPERIVQWLRAHIQPTPSSLNVYTVLADEATADSPWYIVVEVPQGQTAYMAKDHKFYKRVSNIVQPMEQYEVADVMNRSQAAALDLRIPRFGVQGSDGLWAHLSLGIEVTSTNFVASEYGALKLTLAYPLRFGPSTGLVFPGSEVARVGMVVGDAEAPVPHATSLMVRWGAHTGSVVFPGDWFDFHGNSFQVEVPGLSVISSPTYLFKTELFTLNRQSREALFSIQRSSDSFEVSSVGADKHAQFVEAFWQTCHVAQEKLASGG